VRSAQGRFVEANTCEIAFTKRDASGHVQIWRRHQLVDRNSFEIESEFEAQVAETLCVFTKA
jgi:hypothetical protein